MERPKRKSCSSNNKNDKYCLTSSMQMLEGNVSQQKHKNQRNQSRKLQHNQHHPRDAKWIKTQLVRFLEGKQSFVGLVDTLHNGKNLRYLIIGGSCVVVLGNYVIDPEMLRLADVPKDIWRVKDWACDRVVLELCSLNTGMSSILLCFSLV